MILCTLGSSQQPDKESDTDSATSCRTDSHENKNSKQLSEPGGEQTTQLVVDDQGDDQSLVSRNSAQDTDRTDTESEAADDVATTGIDDTNANNRKDAKPSGATYTTSRGKVRHRTTQEELEVLEAVWRQTHMPSSKVRQELAERLNMTVRRVQIWFQNRRAKLRKRQLQQQQLTAYKEHTEIDVPPTKKKKLSDEPQQTTPNQSDKNVNATKPLSTPSMPFAPLMPHVYAGIPYAMYWPPAIPPTPTHGTLQGSAMQGIPYQALYYPHPLLLEQQALSMAQLNQIPQPNVTTSLPLGCQLPAQETTLPKTLN